MPRLGCCHVQSDLERIEFQWQGFAAAIRLAEHGVDDRWLISDDSPLGWRSVEVELSGGALGHPDYMLLQMLSVFFGENLFPDGVSQTQKPDQRGNFTLTEERLLGFVGCAQNWLETARIQNPWRVECLRTALGYFIGAVEMGLRFTPVTEGMFAVCLEVIANAWNFSPDTTRIYGKKGGPESMLDSLFARDHEMHADLALLLTLRNKTGSHFGLHVRREREALVTQLRAWLVRRHCTQEFAVASFEENRVTEDIQRHAGGLYNTALTLARLGFFILFDAQEFFTMAQKDGQP